MGQPNFSTINKWKKVWVAEFHEKKHQSSIRGQNRVKWLRDGPVHCEMEVAEFLETFETWLHLENFDYVERIWRQCDEMFSKECPSENHEARKKGT